MNAQHLSQSMEHYTPPKAVEPARVVLGGKIEFDPASCALANTIVRAETFLSLPLDGLAEEWHGCTLVNPPGGRPDPKWAKIYGSQSSAVVWWRKLVEECLAGRVPAAIFIGFSLEILQAAQDPEWSDPTSFPFCVPSERLRFFVSADAWSVQLRIEWSKPATTEKRKKSIESKLEALAQHAGRLVEGDQPTHANVICYLGNEVEKFQQAYSQLGKVVVP